MFVPGKTFKPSQMFAGKAGAYPIEAPFKCSILGEAPGLAHSQYTRLERLVMSKPSSLIQKFVTYGRSEFYNIGLSAIS